MKTKQIISKRLVNGILCLTLLFLSSCAMKSKLIGFQPQEHTLGPSSTIGLSEFQLVGPVNNKMAPALGAAGGVAGAVGSLVGQIIDDTKEKIDKSNKP